MVNYANIAQNALTTIQANGTAYTLRNVSGETYDPATNAVTGGSTEDETVYGILTNYKQHQIDGQNVKRDDKMLLLAAQGITGEVTTASKIIQNSDTWNIVYGETINPGGTVLLYRLQVRR